MPLQKLCVFGSWSQQLRETACSFRQRVWNRLRTLTAGREKQFGYVSWFSSNWGMHSLWADSIVRGSRSHRGLCHLHFIVESTPSCTKATYRNNDQGFVLKVVMCCQNHTLSTASSNFRKPLQKFNISAVPGRSTYVLPLQRQSNHYWHTTGGQKWRKSQSRWWGHAKLEQAAICIVTLMLALYAERDQ